MRHRYVWDTELKQLVEVSNNYRQETDAPAVFADLPGYESPVTGKWVEGRRARREDLKRSGCRPYEGRDQELKESRKVEIEREKKLDQLAERIAHRAWAEAPESIRKHFRSR